VPSADDRSEPDAAPGRADRAAERLRELIITGRLAPGERLSEARVSDSLTVSRNTLREAFRMLEHEGLLTRRPNSGVFVAIPSLASIIDIYRVRRMIECQALAAATPKHPAARRMGEAIQLATASRDAGDWGAVGTANMLFHAGIVALADSAHLDRLYANISAELRLAFGLLDDPEYLHRPYGSATSTSSRSTATATRAAPRPSSTRTSCSRSARCSPPTRAPSPDPGSTRR
jgi:DNA-binding GntR family transcriptional regulator